MDFYIQKNFRRFAMFFSHLFEHYLIAVIFFNMCNLSLLWFVQLSTLNEILSFVGSQFVD